MSSNNIITIKPSIENCDPFKKYQKSTPLKYSLQEIPILYGGGRKWILNCSNPRFFKSLKSSVFITNEILVDIFVLNTSLIIWFNSIEIGIELSYLKIPAHAVRKNKDGQLELYIQYSSPAGEIDDDDGNNESNDNDNEDDELIEFSIIPKYWEDDRFYNDEIEKLFTYEFFGLNKGTKMIYNTFNAIGKCSCLHIGNEEDEGEDGVDQVDEDDDDEVDQMEIDNFYQNGLDNSGIADDMNFNCDDYNFLNKFGETGMDVNIYDDEMNFKIRNRDELLLQDQEFKKEDSNKRVRPC